MANSSTHLADQICIDENQRKADGSIPWLLENNHRGDSHPITPNNGLEVLICGQESFERIAKDIEAAVHSVDLICWGFDPGMELVRSGRAWPRGQPYGSLLHAAAARGVKVRLLVWHEAGLASMKQNNMPGLTGDQRRGHLIKPTTTSREDLAAWGIAPPSPAFGERDGRTPEQLRNDYCVGWWRDVKAPAKTRDKGNRIEFRSRQGDARMVKRNMLDEQDKPSSAAPYLGLATEKGVIEDHATHHQKTVLIDYAWEGGKKAVGYVMGLNSVTDYWDTQEHLFDSPLREVDWARTSATAKALPNGQRISRDPFQDYVCRIVGPSLRGVNKNFVDAWKRAGGALRADDADTLPPKLAQRPSVWRAQIVRTQPEDGDKTIKDTYFHAPQFARDYLYIENQYFFYESWVRHLKDKRAEFMAWLQGAGKGQKDSKMLHLFVVIPWPENDGMVPRTYDMAKSLGEADSFPSQNAAMQKNADARAAWEKLPAEKRADPDYAPAWDPVAESAAQVNAPKKRHTTGELEGLGMKVKIGRLTTFNKGKSMPKPELNYRQVYIHSKLMVIDDSFFTLGSANLNQRSMAADSEINIATDDHDQARALRQKVWGLHAGGYKATAGGDGTSKAIADAFKDWTDVMAINAKRVDAGKALAVGHLVPFSDNREIHYRLG